MICFVQDVKDGEFNANTEELASMVARFPPREAVDEEWCIELLERVAEKQQKPSVKKNVSLDVDEPD
jgi:hypothetical protein